MSCLIDGSVKQVELTNFFSLMRQTKIDNYYLISYFCTNQIHQRGNYPIKSNNDIKSRKIIFINYFINDNFNMVLK